MKFSESHILVILRWSTVCLFLGRACLHIFWNVPYDTLWLEEDWMKGIAHGLGYSWHQWETDESVRMFFNGFQWTIGGVYVLLAGLTSFLKASHPKKLGKLLWLGSGLLFFLAFVSFKSHNYLWPQWWEHTIQFTIPIFFYLALYRPPIRSYLLLLKVAIAMTFTCHGLFAFGWPFETPANFLEMVRNILPLNDEMARIFLTIAGGLDFVVSLLIFFPKWSRAALIYAVIWGSLTALARVVAHVDLDQTLLDLLRWLPETILRIPHATIPLVVWMLIKSPEKGEL